MNIVPKPQKVEIHNEKFLLKECRVTADCDEIYEFAECINNWNSDYELSFKGDSGLGGEHHKIEIKQNGIKVLYGDLEGAFRAVSTLKQILAEARDCEINAMSVEDFPSIKNRGYMLDISRGKIPNLDYLKKLADIMADLKYNQLQLYMDSFVFEYRNFSEYTRDTEPLTAAEIKELDEYCKKRFIKLVPNQNGFGHMGAWTAKKELSHLAVTGKDNKPSATLNPLLDESLELVDKIYDGMFDSFSADCINIGMDETVELGMNETKESCEKYGTGNVYTEYLNKVCRLVSEKYHKTPMFWDDIVFKHEEQIENVDKNAVFMHWGYEKEHHFDRNCRKLKENGLNFYVCPGTSMWGSYTGRTHNATANIAAAAECGSYYGAEGFLLTEWGDDGHPQFPSTSYFQMIFGGAMSWNAGLHNVEAEYASRNDVIKRCINFEDKYIFNCSGEKSLGDIAYRMGNYYLLEDGLEFNRTELDLIVSEKKAATKQQSIGFARVKDYMISLKKELDEVCANEIPLREIKLNCDMVILLASKCIEPDRDYSEQFADMKAEFEALWLENNHRAGIEICMNKILNFLKI